MKVKEVGALLVLSALWGGSFLCIRIAAPVLGPVVLVELRVLIAGLALLLYSLAIRQELELHKHWPQYLAIGILNSAFPFTLIATAELHLTASFAAILNATSPLFGSVVAALWLREVLTVKKITGLLLGLIGVGVLVGWSQQPFSMALVLSILASLVGAAFFGLASVYTKVNMRGTSSVAIATCSQLGASLFLLPLTPFFPTPHTPSPFVILTVAVLALFCTAICYLIYFWLIETIGPTRAITVTFLAPAFGVLWSILFLDEIVTWSIIIGFAIILVGTGFLTGIRASLPYFARRGYRKEDR